MQSKYFKPAEFRCKCGKCEMPDIAQSLLDVLDDVREHFGQPTMITSGYRCPAHNKAVGGAPDSRHTHADASDIKVKNVTPKEVHAYLTGKYPGRYGIGLYPSWVHIDTRPNGPARWGKG